MHRDVFIAKIIMAVLTIIFFTVPLFGCATTYDRGNGIIVAEKKLQGRDYRPHNATKIGAAIGGGAGGIGGAVWGGLFGFVLGTLGDATGIGLAAITLGGAATGAVIVGGVGAITCGCVGYAIDCTTPNAGLYQFIVKPDYCSKPIAITQYATPIPLHSRVHILEKNHSLFIKRQCIS